jgi:hypothetical protein
MFHVEYAQGRFSAGAKVHKGFWALHGRSIIIPAWNEQLSLLAVFCHHHIEGARTQPPVHGNCCIIGSSLAAIADKIVFFQRRSF